MNRRACLMVAVSLLAVAGCATMTVASGKEPPPTDGAPIADGGAADAAPWHNPEAGLCCQLTQYDTPDPYWQNMRYICDPEAGISNVTVGGNDIPWLCNIGDGGVPTSCDDPSCGVGQACQGFNGTGLVLPCDQQDW